MGKIIGIDLGTTTSEIAYIKNGKPDMIVDKKGKRIIPSVVNIKDGKVKCGEEALNALIVEPSNTTSEFKRFIGEDTLIKVGEEKFLPHEISAILLKHIKEQAEVFFGEEVTEAVITVPANFNSHQRRLTQAAGKEAGLKVERVINEPTAAAMAYGIDNLDADSKILVYDIGGGTFDVTVLEMFGGIIDVKSSRGNNKLGGKDFDDRIEKYILEEFKKEYNKNLYDLAEGSTLLQIKQRVKEGAKKAKEDLSFNESTLINIPFLVCIDNTPISLSIELSRVKFNELTEDLVLLTKKPLEEALKAAKYSREDIDIVLLIGGSSRIVAIKKLVEQLFPGKLKGGINPDEAVAMGAAIQAGIKSGKISSKDSLIITDKCSYNLGVSILEHPNINKEDLVFDCIIERDSSIPCTSEIKRYCTVSDNQTAMILGVYESRYKRIPIIENDYNNENYCLIGEVYITPIPPNLAGKEEVDIKFNYNLNGILEVTANVVSTKKELKAIISNEKLNESRGILNKYMVDNDSHDYKDDTKWKECELSHLVERTIELAEKKMTHLDKDQLIKLKPILEKLKKAVIQGDEELVEKYDDQLIDILFEI